MIPSIPSGCETCPNRKTTLGKGYSYLFAILLTALLGWSSITFKYSRSQGLEVTTRDLPAHILIGYLILVGGALGINTDKIASSLGAALSSGKELS